MEKKFKNLKLIKDVLPFLWVNEKKIINFLIFFGLILISICLSLSVPVVLKETVSRLSTSGRSMTYDLMLLLISYGLIWTLSQTIQQVRQIIMVRLLESSIQIFCSKLFNHLHSLPMKFHLERRTGAITNALDRAQNAFPNIFLGLFLFIIPTIIELFLASSILYYYYGYVYAFILFCVASVFFAFTFYAIKWASRYQALCNEQHMKTYANIVDSLLNFASVKYFNNKEEEVLKCNALLNERKKLLVKSISNMEHVRIGQSLIIGAGLIFLTLTAGKQTLLKICDISDFVLINGYILQFTAPLNHIGFIARDLRRGLNELTNVMEIYKTKPTSSFYPGRLISLKKLKSIEFKEVSFGYEPSRLVLKNINFKLESGKTMGIVGTTGSGKSTISSLLFKFYDVQTGKILINNHDIQTLKGESLYSLLGIVPQDITLFNTTIYENILFAHPNAHKKEVEEVIELAHLEPILRKLPHHYDTIVGERGLKLSGGEKQRIAIARVLLKRPALYIFDEATSSLDTSTEKTIMNNIAPILKCSTSLIIAHRLSAVSNADEIIILCNGSVEERGDHISLLKKQGLYTSMWKIHEEHKDI